MLYIAIDGGRKSDNIWKMDNILRILADKRLWLRVWRVLMGLAGLSVAAGASLWLLALAAIYYPPLSAITPAEEGISWLDRSATGTVVGARRNGAATIAVSGEEVALVRGHDAPVTAARFLHGGTELITVDATGRVRLTRTSDAVNAAPAAEWAPVSSISMQVWARYLYPLAGKALELVSHTHLLRFRDCSDCPEMAAIPPGRFLMGSPPDEPNRRYDEDPQHEVTIAASFAIGRFEVTRDQYAAFVAASGYSSDGGCEVADFSGDTIKGVIEKERNWESPGYPQSGQHPVVCVSWDDAKAYVKWLSAKTGRNYRLLSEAEWEYGARAGSVTPYSFGDKEEDLCRYGNVADAALKALYPGLKDPRLAACDDGNAWSAPVGSYLPNAFGLYDMHGNAAEWTVNRFSANYVDVSSDGSAFTAANDKIYNARGGFWGGSPDYARSASRQRASKPLRISIVGFRVARKF